MIIELPDTTVSKISRALVNVREEGGAVALGRVLTLLIVTRHGAEEEVIEAANDASREHPMRVIVVMVGDEDAEPRLDAQIRVGGDAGASEVIVLQAHGAGGLEHREPRHGPPAARCSRRRLVARPPADDAVCLAARQDRAAADHGCLDPPVRCAAARRARREPRAGRHRPRLDAPDALARAARRGARPAAVRADHRGARQRREQLALDRAPRRVAAPHARRAGGLAVPRAPRNGATASSRCAWCARAATSSSSARRPRSRACTSLASPITTSSFPVEPSASASQRSSVASIPTSCMVE